MTSADLPAPLNTPSAVTTWPPVPGERSPLALILVTADRHVCAANETATRWFNPPRLMLPLARFLGIPEHDPRGEALQAFLDELKADPRPGELRLNLFRANGEVFSALLMATPLRDAEDSHLGFDAVLLDLSRWRDREALVPRTEVEVLQRRLQAAERSLGLLRREMEGFSQILGHDLRAPLRHVLAYLRLLRERTEGLGDAAIDEYAAGIQQASSRLGEMVEAMHDYVHLCRAQLDVQDVPLGPVVASVLGHLPSLRERGAARAPIDWRIAPDLPTVRGDPMLLAQLWRHLLDNAAKFTRGVAQPVVHVGWMRGNDGSLVFHVEDNGVGFDRQRAEKLFLLFQRQHHSTAFEGLGVGLAMSHRIVARHGGCLSCDATPDGGCRVRVTLPTDAVDGPGFDLG
ncbi:sensor histidine kinase [Hydrogenophaga crocea]|uniref:histidine kinase n=1 Tax=Hydrogenophaga crocea TaxID=2716225 RepID=A0A6G8IIV9_9BURK|nr:ATP-binding protein [Hydrogenophaga crocea]QIM53091.1 hypothetical protein G9Q37_13510 [Hydrogenophaga crocea]